jgi:hypothetical protein
MIVRNASRTLPPAIAASRSVPVSRTSIRIPSATRAAGTPNRTAVQRQPMPAMSHAPTSATTTVPTLPPAMWALMANPRRSLGNCSASMPLPTGCCGAPPNRETTLIAANEAKFGARDWSAKPPPKSTPPAPSSRRRDTTRVSCAKLSWTAPDRNAPVAARNAIASVPTPNSSMIRR